MFHVLEHPQNSLVPVISYVIPYSYLLLQNSFKVNRQNLQMVMLPKNHKAHNFWLKTLDLN